MRAYPPKEGGMQGHAGERDAPGDGDGARAGRPVERSARPRPSHRTHIQPARRSDAGRREWLRQHTIALRTTSMSRNTRARVSPPWRGSPSWPPPAAARGAARGARPRQAQSRMPSSRRWPARSACSRTAIPASPTRSRARGVRGSTRKPRRPGSIAELGEPVTFQVAAEGQFLQRLTGAGIPPGYRRGLLSCSSRVSGRSWPARTTTPPAPSSRSPAAPRARRPSSSTTTARNSPDARASPSPGPARRLPRQHRPRPSHSSCNPQAWRCLVAGLTAPLLRTALV